MNNKKKETKKAYETSDSFTGIRIGKKSKSAGGITAVKVAMQHLIKEVGLVEGTKTMLNVNQMDGFDCPGCAWPDPDNERSKLGELCENGAKAIAEEATRSKADPAFFERHSISSLAAQSDYWLGKSGRITHPIVKRENEDHYEPIRWADAFELIVDRLNLLESPNEAIFYTSGRTSNEAAFLYQLMVRGFGTNNLPDCSNMCHESSGVALSETVGIGKGSVKLDDFEKCEVIIVIGQNPGTNHPRMLSALKKAKLNGAKIITINPLPETGLLKFKHPQHLNDVFGGGVTLTDLFLQVKINQDVALLKAILKRLIEVDEIEGGKVLDHDFIASETSGFEDFTADLKKYSIDDLIVQSGVSAQDVESAVDLLKNKDKIIVCWAMGLTQHRNAVDNIREIVNLLLIKGSIGKPGAGTCPVRGHSNVQGDRTMGIWEKPKKEFLDRLAQVFQFDPPREEGYDTVDAIHAMARGKAKVFIGLGGNFLSATPDTGYTAKALQQCDLTVQISTKLNRGHLITGKIALILPTLGRTEKDIQEEGQQVVTVENSTGVVHQSKGNKEPISKDLLSEPKIIIGIAKRLLNDKLAIDWAKMATDYDHIRRYIEKVIPGFEDYNNRMKDPGGFYLPNGARERKFATHDKKANFTLNNLPSYLLKPNEYLMMTIRSHDQFNTTIYGLNDRYRGVFNERRVIFMNKHDMKVAGLVQKDIVDLFSDYNGDLKSAKKFLVIPFDIPKQCVATYFPEANTLIHVDNYAYKSKTPVSKSTIITIEKHKGS